ncbi:oxidoreductase [Paucilactobacillus nenjiangensis]|jgi:NADP-dependent 3-hydroxy acid dehydrogenase YdfG|uniref:SDR family NAD(P)-dependent oxidoreductase n=1 Tax=Paucilactobacillus nenjiangensis TaxID=1296540 RepID=A0A5P1X2Q3_9LACO|nr:oxidoreductase [Paucilactobacillus nenjiangensis]QER68182.1 SDR family NAD(P)-dependent oxidoreductase [Paucilactobacillus nenjiangensis]
MAEEKVWLITGTSTGFGKNLVEELQKTNAKIAATARNVAKIQHWADNKNTLLLELDVTKEDQVAKAVSDTIDKFGRIDVLVNNAGWGYFGSVEEADEKAVRSLMETNFWGLSAMTRAVLPTMRSQKSGQIINISSIAGILGGAGIAYYNATKHAVEGFSKGLAYEVEPLGIKITNVEPGPFRTDWAGRSHQAADSTIADYAKTAHSNTDRFEGNSGQQDGSPDLLAKAIIKLSNVTNPPLHFLAGANAVERAHEEIERLQQDFDVWEEDSTHLSYGDEDYWN